MNFVVVAVSGLLLFAAQATLLAVNPALRQIKQLVFARAIAIISLLVWTGIVICGRFIAYT